MSYDGICLKSQHHLRTTKSLNIVDKSPNLTSPNNTVCTKYYEICIPSRHDWLNMVDMAWLAQLCQQVCYWDSVNLVDFSYYIYCPRTKTKRNKAIRMMRGKSPRSDIEMTIKLNFVAAILDFWRAFLNQFWPNLVHTYKTHFWISFVLCVVFKCQYFEVIPEKPIF